MGLPTGDYLSQMLALPHITPLGLLTLFFMGLFRIAPIVALTPFLGSKLPGGVKIGLAMCLTLIMIPLLAHTSHTTFAFNIEFVGWGLKELLVGFIIAFLAAIPFYIAEGSGSFIDFMRGASSLQVTDPMTQTQTSTIGVLFNYVMIVIFFQVGGLFIFLSALVQSYEVLPVDQMINASFFSLHVPFWKLVVGLLTRITAISVQLAAPSLVSILMAEMFLGIANRLAPQVQIVFLGMSLKSLLGLGLLWAAWAFIMQQMGKQSILWIRDLNEALRYMGL